jgi:Type ISP C-terminal specificity domain
MSQLLAGRNVALCTVKSVETGDEYGHAFVTNVIADHHCVSIKEVNYIFPALIYGDQENGSEQRGLFRRTGNKPTSNFSSEFLSLLEDRVDSGPKSADPYGLLAYVYSILYSAAFRHRYGAFLRKEFARIPVPTSSQLFDALVELGTKLIALHLMEEEESEVFSTSYKGPNSPEVGRIGWSDNTVWLDAVGTKNGRTAISGTIGFHGVPETVWNFQIGGYQVCEKWLKDRKGRVLSKSDITHYQRIVAAQSETIRLMKKIDDVIEEYGGWPAAFAQDRKLATKADRESNVASWMHSKSTAVEYRTVPSEVLEAAESKAQPYGEDEPAKLKAINSSPENLDREDIICRIRQLFADGQERARDEAISSLAQELDHQLTAENDKELSNALRTAVRRGILDNNHGSMRLFARTIEEYQRDFLKEQFLAALHGRQWIQREDAIRAFARWMGFRRTGPAIENMARSLINGLLREGSLEGDSLQIRRCGQDV